MKQGFLFFILLIIVISCHKTPETNLGTIKNCFSASKPKILPGETITFSNCSEGAENYSWDFGDGTTSTLAAPTHAYTNSGSYTVSLTATSVTNSLSAKGTTVIQVGNRYLTKINIKQMPAVKNSNEPWDVGNAADLKFYLGKASNTSGYDYSTPEATDAILPYEWDLTSQNIMLTNENWKFRITDADSTTEEEMGLLPAFNPTTQGSNGVISFSSTNSLIEIKYDFK